MMLRLFSALTILGLLAAASAPAAAAPAAAAPPPGLESVVQSRGSVVVDDDLIRLGDLFDGTGAKADTAVAYAPEPGRHAEFDARWLSRIARAHGLNWLPRSRTVRTMVQRASVVVAPADLEDRILTALADSGVSVSGRRVDFGGAPPQVHLPADPAAMLAVESVAYDPRGAQFAAVLLTSLDGIEDRRLRVSGRLQDMTSVPVVVRRLGAGEVIGKDDIEIRTVQTRLLPGDAVLDEQDLIGRTPRHVLRPGTPIRRTEVRTPIIIARGELVTVILATPQMLLTARGRALDDGGRDDVVRIRNLNSNGVIEARVSGPGQATVGIDPEFPLE
jgi:flagellar basal body P-ring formation protein FlgA